LESKSDIIISGIDTKTGKPGIIRVPRTTREDIIEALIKKACKGNISAIKEIFNRVEGKPVFVLTDKKVATPYLVVGTAL
jgi:hypothetical protein